ncbi:sulfurtransferase TusA family protein [Magnetofaba australis]|uniref:Putative SirA-like domain-containing protein n=1 Tax=Magnetofaba australis IT-1 TaxID=1434232 RepID=A0A1Y2K8P6_9PROT|nr:sulfurtransferase TusA family protein [Magnetofaba australis]OSM06816.1 putative SirA-like domain-containing protein [Magnetofaba australis IT-1]
MSDDAFLDITADHCPMTFVKVKLKLESLPPGSVLQVRLSDGEPLHNVPRSLLEQGFELVSPPAEDGTGAYLLSARRA